MDKIDRRIRETALPNSSLLNVEKRCPIIVLNKIDELVEEWNSHREWHRRFFDKYNKTEEDFIYEEG